MMTAKKMGNQPIHQVTFNPRKTPKATSTKAKIRRFVTINLRIANIKNLKFKAAKVQILMRNFRLVFFQKTCQKNTKKLLKNKPTSTKERIPIYICNEHYYFLFKTKQKIMKKILTAITGIALVAGTAAFASSCSKEQDWNCKCTVNGQESTSIIKDKTRKEATAECNKSGSVLGVDYDCKLSLF